MLSETVWGVAPLSGCSAIIGPRPSDLRISPPIQAYSRQACSQATLTRPLAVTPFILPLPSDCRDSNHSGPLLSHFEHSHGLFSPSLRGLRVLQSAHEKSQSPRQLFLLGSASSCGLRPVLGSSSSPGSKGRGAGQPHGRVADIEVPWCALADPRGFQCQRQGQRRVPPPWFDDLAEGATPLPC